MPRIRSVHPSIFTEEGFVELTETEPLAIALLVGIWTEADDGGVFEWKARQLKLRVLPGEIPTKLENLLIALERCGYVRRFSVEGQDLGVVRDFAKYQRPKYPNYQHPFTTEMREFAGFQGDGTRPPGSRGRQSSTPNSPRSGNEGENNEADFGNEGWFNNSDFRENPKSARKGEERRGDKEENNIRGDKRHGSEGGGSDDQAPKHDGEGSDLPSQVVALWNSMAQRFGLAKAERLTDPRRSRIIARGKDLVRLYRAESPLAGFERLFDKVAESPFLRGESSDWRANLDWVLTPQNMTKVLEGQYERSGNKTSAPHQRAAAI